MSTFLLLSLLCTIRINRVRSFQKLNVLSNTEVATKSGRFTQIKIGNDGLPFMVYNNENYGCVGISHCNDIYCKNITTSCIDPSSNRNNAWCIFMKMHPLTQLPVFTYSIQGSTNSTLKYVACLNTYCSKYNLTNVYTIPNTTIISYSSLDFNALNHNYTFIVFTAENVGLYIIECLNSECTEYKGPVLISNGLDHQAGWYPSVSIYYYYNYQNYNSFDAFNTFWDQNGYLGFAIYNAEYEVVEFGTIDDERKITGDNLGRYQFMIGTPADNQTYAYGVMWNMMYTDQTNGDLKYANCSINAHTNNIGCDYTILDSIGIAAYGVFPEMDYYSTFGNGNGPILSYIDQSDNTTSKLKVLQCNSMLCNQTAIQVLASGLPGYGRDSSIAWSEKNNLLYVSFLDYNGGDNKIARLLVVQVS
eukprot:124805_1